MQNALKSNEWQWIWVYKSFKIQIQEGGGGANNADFLQNWLLQKLGPHFLISRNFATLRKALLNHAKDIDI